MAPDTVQAESGFLVGKMEIVKFCLIALLELKTQYQKPCTYPASVQSSRLSIISSQWLILVMMMMMIMIAAANFCPSLLGSRQLSTSIP